jgi:hypothetical protein
MAAPMLFECWLDIINQAFSFRYENCNDIIKWKWGGRGHFTSKSVYDHLTKDDCGANFQHIWKSKIPLEIKIFTWQLENNAIPTKDNMVKRKWDGNPSCMFCEQLETLNHLFFQCSTTKVVWGIVAFCFNSNTIPIGIQHYKQWIHYIFPQGKAFHHFGFAAICWAMWKCRNRAVFDKKNDQASC